MNNNTLINYRVIRKWVTHYAYEVQALDIDHAINLVTQALHEGDLGTLLPDHLGSDTSIELVTEVQP